MHLLPDSHILASFKNIHIFEYHLMRSYGAVRGENLREVCHSFFLHYMRVAF